MRESLKTVGIDLTPLLRGGANGGVKPLIFRSLAIVSAQLSDSATFVFFTNSSTHGEVASLAKSGDALVCILPIDKVPIPGKQVGHVRHDPGEMADPLLLQKHDVDVLYCPFGAAHLASPGIPTICCIVDTLHKEYPQTLAPEEVTHRETYFQNLTKIADSINCISKHVIDQISLYYPHYKNEIFYTYNAIVDRFDSIDAKTTTIPQSKYFFYPANFWPHKNHEILIIAFNKYVRSVTGEAWHLVLTGSDPERSAEIRAIAESLNIQDRVHFLRHLSENALKYVWESCSALVFPSLHEGFGIPLLEAMYFAKPIISSNACCLREVGGDAPLYIDPKKPIDLAEAMIQLAESPEIQKERAQLATSRLRSYKMEEEIRKLSSAIMNAEPRSIWSRGIDPFGSFDENGFLSIPSTEGRWKLTLKFKAITESKNVSIYVSNYPRGTYLIGSESDMQIELWIRSPQGQLQISISPENNKQAPNLIGGISSVKLEHNEEPDIILLST